MPSSCFVLVLSIQLHFLYTRIAFSSQEAQNNNQEILSDVLQAFDRSLNYYQVNVVEINLDGIFGLRIAEGVLETTLRTRDPHSPLSTRIRALKSKSIKIINESLSYLKSANLKYYNEVSYVVENRWRLVRPFRRLANKSVQVDEQEVLTHSGVSYQPCLMTVFGSRGSKPCNVTRECWKKMTKLDHIGYSLTHQALYFMFAQQIKGCSSIITAKLRQSNFKGGFNHLYDVICSLMYSQRNVLEKTGIKKNLYLDMYFEQGVICGLLGYKDFLSKPTSIRLLRSQFPSGCYGFQKHNPKRRRMTDKVRLHRTKRTSKLLSDGCESHITGVATALLSLNIRWLSVL